MRSVVSEVRRAELCAANCVRRTSQKPRDFSSAQFLSGGSTSPFESSRMTCGAISSHGWDVMGRARER